MCEALTTVYFTHFRPDYDDFSPDRVNLRSLGSYPFMTKCCPPYGSKWREGPIYVEHTAHDRTKVTSAALCDRLVEMLRSIEGMFGVQGWLVLAK